jgi:phosphatidate cytidylyltransferase
MPGELAAALPGAAAPKGGRAGRNLPAAIAVGVLLGGVALLTLFTVKFTFLVYMGVIILLALLELSRALGGRGIRVPVLPLAAGGAAMLVLAYLRGERPLVAALAITAIVVLCWRLRGGSEGYLRDTTAAFFALLWLLLPAAVVGLLLAPANGPRRTVVFLILGVCSDIGGYLAGSLVGRHPMVPRISPKKTWEGFGGSVAACLVAGALTMTILLHGALWQGLLVGAGAVVAATVGDLAESMIKRDLQIKDMGSMLPGHGGILDRLDSLLITVPVVWVLLVIFLG